MESEPRRLLAQGGGRQGRTQWGHQQWATSGSWSNASKQESWQNTGQVRRSHCAEGYVTRRQAQAAKAKSGRPQTISKEKIRQVLERWVNRHLQGPSSQAAARDPSPPPNAHEGVDQLAGPGQPPQPPPTHEGVAGSPKSSATQPMGGRLEHGSSQLPESLGEQLASLEPGLGHQPMDRDWPPPGPTGGRLDPAKGSKEEEVPGEPGPGQTSSPSETAAPGSYIRRFLGPAKSPAAGESGQAGSAAAESSDGESGESGSANDDEEVTGESESGTPDSGQFS